MCANNQSATKQEIAPVTTAEPVDKSSTILHLLASQIQYAMQESSQAVNALTGSFIEIMDHVQAIRGLTGASASDVENSAILQECQDISDKMQSSIIAFQFYDKLTQRLQHASNSIDTMAHIAQLPADLLNEALWDDTEKSIRSTYTIEGDRRLFEAAMAGEDIDNLPTQITPQEVEETDIELF